jgi:hypothetical protein
MENPNPDIHPFNLPDKYFSAKSRRTGVYRDTEANRREWDRRRAMWLLQVVSTLYWSAIAFGAGYLAAVLVGGSVEW